MTTLVGAPYPLPRYVCAARADGLSAQRVDVLVIGAGVAGLSVALSLPQALNVAVALKGRAFQASPAATSAPTLETTELLDREDYRADGSSGHAQGGIAAVLGADDSRELHFADTLAAGGGLCEPRAVRVLVNEAPDAVRFLESQGVRLDAAGGSFDLTREGGHSRRRIVHAGGDATGRELMRGLTEAALARGVRLIEESFLVDLLTGRDGEVCGALVLSDGRLSTVLARAVVLATGGFGRLFAETTSPPVCTGDGLAAAMRAGAEVADLEFVQFHPTAIQLSSDPRPLASESLRGEGAVIRNSRGVAVMQFGGGAGDLAPRDVVSRTMALEMRSEGTDHLFLDATGIGAGIAERFPSFVGASRRAGIDPLRDWVPIAPAVHYVMGGVCTDLSGRSSLGGLYAVGEVAQSGVHGANRLASNSLVEGVVFGRRAARALLSDLEGRPEPAAEEGNSVGESSRVERSWLRREMTEQAGLLRTREGLARLSSQLASEATRLPAEAGLEEIEDANLLLIANALVASALRREESRGAHFRLDHPASLERWRCHQVLRRDSSGRLFVDDRLVDEQPPIDAVVPAPAGRQARPALLS